MEVPLRTNAELNMSTNRMLTIYSFSVMTITKWTLIGQVDCAVKSHLIGPEMIDDRYDDKLRQDTSKNN